MYRITPPFLAALLALTLALPMNIYLIGDGIGAGIQFAFFRYQQTYMGTNLITLLHDLNYVTSGILTGRSALAVLLWICGTLLLIAAVVYFVCKWYEDYTSIKKPVSFLIAGAGVAYLAAVIAQYGLFFHGPAGFSIPIGVPLIFGVAWVAYHVEIEGEEFCEEEYPDEDDDPEGASGTSDSGENVSSPTDRPVEPDHTV